MRKIVLIYILLCGYISCKSQEFNVHQMVTFDEKVFKNWEIDNAYSSSNSSKYLKKRSKRVEIYYSYNRNTIQVMEYDTLSPYSRLCIYDLATKKRNFSCQYITGVPYGISRYYDKDGNIIKEKDEDKNYLFSIPQLIEKIKTEYQRQIGKRESNIEFRKFEEKEKYYYLVVILPLDPYDVYQKPTTNLVIGGQTGQTLYQETIQYQRDGNDSKANPIEDFLRQQTK